MSWARATGFDVAEISAFLQGHAQTSMFPLINLRDHGLDGSAKRSLSVWVQRCGQITDLIAVTNEGMLMPQAPTAAARDWQAVVPLLAGRDITGALGHAEQVRALLTALSLTDAPTVLDADEPGFDLPLDDLHLPQIAADLTLSPITDTLRPQIIAWRAMYHIETLGTPSADAEDAALRDVASYIKKDSHRVLMQQGTPVSMTGFNAVFGDIVQIGGVFTPPPLRGQGLARTAVALHLQEARQQSITRAVLSAANPAAAAAYRAIGFQKADPFAMVLMSQAQRIPPCP